MGEGEKRRDDGKYCSLTSAALDVFLEALTIESEFWFFCVGIQLRHLNGVFVRISVNKVEILRLFFVALW